MILFATEPSTFSLLGPLPLSSTALALPDEDFFCDCICRLPPRCLPGEAGEGEWVASGDVVAEEAGAETKVRAATAVAVTVTVRPAEEVEVKPPYARSFIFCNPVRRTPAAAAVCRAAH